jgi:hypothetical protein
MKPFIFHLIDWSISRLSPPSSFYGWLVWITQPHPTNLDSLYLGKQYKTGFKKKNILKAKV